MSNADRWSGADACVQTRAWVISDLQSVDPDEARRCLETAVEDVMALELDLDYVWYLGDGISGHDLELIRRVTDLQVELLERLAIPVRYVMGNHDIDYAKETGEVSLPLYEAVRSHPGWRTTTAPDDFAFIEDLGEWTVLFLSDHVGPAAEWSVTHGRHWGEADLYPYTEADYRAVIERVSEAGKPTVVAGHNAFPGGNRPAEIQRWFFPLPACVALHLYGHAHIGDEAQANEHAYRTIAGVDHHPIPQIDVASLEDRRGDTIRSAVLELGPNGSYAVSLRDHARGTWLESYRDHGRPPGRG